MGRLPRTPFFGSLAIHLALVLAVLALRGVGDTPRAADSAPRTDAKLVFLDDPGFASGGGGSGARRTEPMRRVEARGADPVTAPVAPPPAPSPQPVSATMEAEVPVVAAVPAFADIDTTQGAIDPSRGTLELGSARLR